MSVNPEVFSSSLPALAPGEVLSYAQPWLERFMAALRRSSGEHQLNVVFDPDLLAVRTTLDRPARSRDLLVVRRQRRPLFLDARGRILPPYGAAPRLLRLLLDPAA